MPFILRAPERRAHRPQGPGMAVLGAMLLQPSPLVIHEVAKPAGIRVESMPTKSQIGIRQPLQLRLRATHFLHEHGEDKSAGVVVRAVGFVEVGHVIDRVLKDPRVVAHVDEMIEL